MIEAYISENGTEPETNDPLSAEDLVTLNTQRSVRPRPPTLTSIPSMLSVFQEEWDSLALQTHKLQQDLAQARQELSNALYQHDAAVRVIARLTKERDDAREALGRVNVAAPTNGDAMHVDPTPLPASIVEKVQSTQERYVPAHIRNVFCPMLTWLQSFGNPAEATGPRRLGYWREYRYILPESHDANPAPGRFCTRCPRSWRSSLGWRRRRVRRCLLCCAESSRAVFCGRRR